MRSCIVQTTRDFVKFKIRGKEYTVLVRNFGTQQNNYAWNVLLDADGKELGRCPTSETTGFQTFLYKHTGASFSGEAHEVLRACLDSNILIWSPREPIPWNQSVTLPKWVVVKLTKYGNGEGAIIIIREEETDAYLGILLYDPGEGKKDWNGWQILRSTPLTSEKYGWQPFGDALETARRLYPEG